MRSVSVVIVSYHTGPILFHAVTSVMEQSKVCQVIVVDNGNPESDLNELTRRFGSDHRFVLLTGHGNIGFSKGCNLGVSHACAEILLLLNPDCVVPRSGITALLKIAIGLDGEWMLSPRLVNPDRTEQLGARREILTPWIAFIEGFRLYKIAPNHPYFKRFNHHDRPRPDNTQEVPVASGACLMLSRTAYKSIGGMDESFFFHVEDIDFCLRFRKAGGKIYYCPQTSFVHALGTSEVSRTYVEWHKSIGLARYFRLHFSGVYPPGFTGFVIVSIFVRFALISLKELFSTMLQKIGLVRKSQIKSDSSAPAFFIAKETLNEKIVDKTPELHEQQSSHIKSPDSYA